MFPSLGVWGYPPILLSHSFLIITITIPWGPWSLDNEHFSLSLVSIYKTLVLMCTHLLSSP